VRKKYQVFDFDKYHPANEMISKYEIDTKFKQYKAAEGIHSQSVRPNLISLCMQLLTEEVGQHVEVPKILGENKVLWAKSMLETPMV
jgi:hypothetical protein